ncbi:hypothetical protein ACLMJK_003013 [Lecanora helva]
MSTTNTTSTDTISSETMPEKTATTKASYSNVSPQSGSLRKTTPSTRPQRPENRRGNTKGSMKAEEYFTHPMDNEEHSKIPYFMRMQGSITPRLLVPLVVVGAWATLITCISRFVHPLIVSNLLLTVLGFVVALGISFRTSSAYERYVEGRKYWAQLSQSSRDLARQIWIHAQERHDKDPQLGKEDLLGKLTALNLIVAFSVALMHKLRFEPYASYDDLADLVSNLSTFAGDAYDPEVVSHREASKWKKAGDWLGLAFAESNPRKLIQRSKKNLGNLPLEILTYLSAYVESIVQNKTFDNGTYQAMVMNDLNSMSEVLAGCERVLSTPLPVAYSIAISQITWVYVLALPFQLWKDLQWITIPGTVVGAYIILGIAAIGRQIEDPFGHDTNDLPLERFCNQIKTEIDIISSKAPPKPEDFIKLEENKVLYSLSHPAWNARSTEDIRASLKAKANTKSGSSEPLQEVGRVPLAAV